MTTVHPYGRWPSPLAADLAAAGKVSLSDLCSDGTALYWLESRPLEGGRVVFVRAGPTDDPVTDLTSPDVSVRSKVHEYGGGAVCLVPGHGDGAFAFVAMDDQRVWLMPGAGAGAEPLPLSPLSPEGQVWRHGGIEASADGDWIVAVREIHMTGDHVPGGGSDALDTDPVRSVVVLGARQHNRGESIVLAGHDFYGTPRFSPGGDRVAAAVWDIPDMPWDFSAVAVVRLGRTSDEPAGTERLVPQGAPWTLTAGGPGAVGESVGQPRWLRDGRLLFVSDLAGWWQPYTHSGTDDGSVPDALTKVAAEFHGADFPLGVSTMAELPDGSLVTRASSEGVDRLVRMPRTARGSGLPVNLEQPCVSISAVCAHGDAVAFIGATAQLPPGIWMKEPDPTPARLVSPTRPPVLGELDISVGEHFSLQGRSGRDVHGVFFAPALGGTQGPAGAAPPLIVHCHGGPTSCAPASFDVTVQFFTSRGFAVASVDYAGSVGYGRAYRCALWGQWGVADSEDCADAARWLRDAGRVDGARMAIRGGSAGGLTALNALTESDGFRAAASWYGVTDLLSLAATAHDFEAHYTDRLIGPLPECRGLYEARSPINRGGVLEGAVLLLQGLSDPVVPPSQAELLRDALASSGRRCEAIFFEGEGHGFRRSDTLATCFETELDFYRRELEL